MKSKRRGKRAPHTLVASEVELCQSRELATFLRVKSSFSHFFLFRSSLLPLFPPPSFPLLFSLPLPPTPPPSSQHSQASFVQNKTQTLINGARGAVENGLEFIPPLKSGLDAQAATTAADLAGATFDPATADWAKIYTGFPQPQVPTTFLDFIGPIGNGNLPVAEFPLVGGEKKTS